jgi:hypothetical protein
MTAERKKYMKKVFMTIGAAAAVVAGVGAVLSFVAPKAIAQIRAALVKNVDEPGRAPYDVYVEVSTFSCFFGGCSNFGNFGGTVLFDLPAVPAGKRLIIKRVSGRLPSSTAVNAHIGFQTSQVISFQLVKWAYFGPFFSEFGVVQSFTADTEVTYGPGEQPHIHMFLPSQTNTTGFLQISGYYIDATN